MTEILVDTCVLLWLASEPERLSRAAADAIQTTSKRYVSYASIWEITIKKKIGNVKIHGTLEDFLKKQIPEAGFDYLPLQLPHFLSLDGLKLSDHRDPFDRMLVAQARAGKIPIVSPDVQFDFYRVKRIW